MFLPPHIDGYTDRVSYAVGDTMTVHLSARRFVPGATLRLYDAGGRVVDSVRATVRPRRARGDAPSSDGFGYPPTFTRRVPALPSGVYRWEGRVPFVVRPSGPVDVLVVYPAHTVAAYNRAGGRSLYGPSRRQRLRTALARLVTFRWKPLLPDPFDERTARVSFRRPGNLAQWEYFAPFLPWAQALPGLRVGFVADPDLEDYGRIAQARLLVVVGHSEYWSRTGRLHFDRHVAAGRPALVLSGNTMWWQVRPDPAGQAITCYKDRARDPVADPRLETIAWADPSLAYPIFPNLGGQFDHGGYGARADAGWDGFRIVARRNPLLAGVALRPDSIVRVRTIEFDGAPMRGEGPDGHPLPDTVGRGLHRFELVGYDRGERGGPTVGTFTIVQRTPSAGVVVHAGSTDWCGERGWRGPDSLAIRRITENAIRRLVAGAPVFSPR